MRKKRKVMRRKLIDFSGTLTAKEFWSDLAVKLIGMFCGMILLMIAITALVPGDTEKIVSICNIVVSIYCLLWIVPIAALTRCRLRDAGFTAKTYLWLLLPVIGWIIFIVRLCAKSVLVRSNSPEANMLYY